MEREEQLRFCRICHNQKFDPHRGIICQVTNEPATFTESCTIFQSDPILKERFEEQNLQNEVQRNLANLGRRFANNLLDSVFYFFFLYILGTLWGVYIVFTGGDKSIFDSLDGLLLRLVGYIALFIYYVIFEASTGRSLGKYITGTKVVTTNGSKPDLQTILLRTLCRFIPFEAFSYFGEEPTGWHDRLSKTYVVRVKNN